MNKYPDKLNDVDCSIGTDGGQIPQAAWQGFCAQMEGRQYGNSETRDSWSWYFNGWMGHIKRPRNDY